MAATSEPGAALSAAKLSGAVGIRPAEPLRCPLLRSSRRGMGHDERELMVDASRDFGEEIGRIGIADRSGLTDRIARRLPEGGKRRRNREHVFLFVAMRSG